MRRLTKRVLYFSGAGRTPAACLERWSGHARALSTEPPVFEYQGTLFELVFEFTPEGVEERLASEYLHAILLDLRGETGPEIERAIRGARTLLARLDRPADIEVRYGFHRIMALVAGDDVGTDDLMNELGKSGVGRVLRERGVDPDFPRRVSSTLVELLAGRCVGKTALAASGGGITGIFFELGALKCLDDCLSPGIADLDMYFGISAGAVVASVLSAGYSVEELMAAIDHHPGGRIPALDLQLFRMSHLNWKDMAARLGAATDIFWHAAYELAWHRTLPSFNDLVLDYTSLVGPPFHSDDFEQTLRGILSASEANNDFRRLKKPLYIGASDQDARRHVVFGSEGRDAVPISVAVQGSLSVNPAFSAVEIDDRYYEDGAVTRTSNFVEAIERGADLVFILDPFVPYVSQIAGTAHRRGVLYNIDQGVRALSYTRFEHARQWALRRHPEVSTYTFLPSNRVRRLLTMNPMDHRPYLAIWRGAYLSTFERIKRVMHRLSGDLEAHGFSISLDRASEVAERLERVIAPSFADFFPGRQVDLDRGAARASR
mgnify:FL=1